MRTSRVAVRGAGVCGVGAWCVRVGLGVLAAACTRPNPAYMPRTDGGAGNAGGAGGAGGTGGTGGTGGFAYTGPPVRCVGVREECASQTFSPATGVSCNHTETSP